MPMSTSQWLLVRSVIVLAAVVVSQVTLALLPGAAADRGSLLVAAVDYSTAVAGAVAVLGLGWSAGTALHAVIGGWYERRLAASMLGRTSGPVRPWREALARSSWTLIALRLHTASARPLWRGVFGLTTMALVVTLTCYGAAAAAGPRSTAAAASRTDLQQVCHRYVTVAEAVMYGCVLAMLLYAGFIAYLVARSAGRNSHPV